MPVGIGNHGPFYGPGVKPQGIGANNRPINSMNWLSLVGGTEPNSFAIFSADSIVYQGMDIGLFFQAVGAPVEVSYTLQNPNLAAEYDPLIQDGVAWSPPQVITPGTIVEADFPVFAAIRIDFTAVAEFYIGAR